MTDRDPDHISVGLTKYLEIESKILNLRRHMYIQVPLDDGATWKQRKRNQQAAIERQMIENMRMDYLSMGIKSISPVFDEIVDWKHEGF